MISIFVICYVLLIHWIADFIFQDERWAINKSNWFDSLLLHTATYSFIMGFGSIVFLPNILSVLIFTVTTFILHTLVDFFTSVVVKKRYNAQYFGSRIPNFGMFTIIGYDQLLHYIMLFYTIHLLI